MSLPRPRRSRRLANRAHPAGIRRDPFKPQTLAAPSKRDAPAVVFVVRGDLLLAPRRPKHGRAAVGDEPPPSPRHSLRRLVVVVIVVGDGRERPRVGLERLLRVHLTGRQGLVPDLLAPVVQPEEPGLSFRRVAKGHLGVVPRLPAADAETPRRLEGFERVAIHRGSPRVRAEVDRLVFVVFVRPAGAAPHARPRSSQSRTGPSRLN